MVSLFNATGSVSKKIYSCEKAFRKLTDPAQLLILNLVVSKPGILLKFSGWLRSNRRMRVISYSKVRECLIYRPDQTRPEKKTDQAVTLST